MIDAYLQTLDGALRGPRKARTELLVEARDSLIDAAEHYERGGLERAAAERRAVAEFGTVAEVAPDYQTELGVAQARRTALLVFVVVGAQSVSSELAWRHQAAGWHWQPAAWYGTLARLVDYAGYAVLGTALLIAVGLGVGSRFVRAGRGAVRATGLGALAACLFFLVGGLVLTVASPMRLSLPTSLTAVALSLASFAPPAWVVASATRCLRFAR